MFTKFAGDKKASNLFAEEMAKRLSKKGHNPFEDEFQDPEEASVDPAALETRHFHVPDPYVGEKEEVWGLDLDDEDLAGMSEESLDAGNKLQELMDLVKDFDDDKLEAFTDLVKEFVGKDTMKEEGEEEALDLSDLPVSTSGKKVKKKIK